jgi:hypothetical protein
MLAKMVRQKVIGNTLREGQPTEQGQHPLATAQVASGSNIVGAMW